MDWVFYAGWSFFACLLKCDSAKSESEDNRSTTLLPHLWICQCCVDFYCHWFSKTINKWCVFTRRWFYILHFPKICPHRPRKPYYISHLSGNSKRFFSWENMNPEYFFPRNFFIPCPVIDPRSCLSRVRFGGGGICGRDMVKVFFTSFSNLTSKHSLNLQHKKYWIRQTIPLQIDHL